jgi:hypothetical protein
MKSFVFILLTFFSITFSYSQEDLLDILEEETTKKVPSEIENSIFKGTRILNGHSVKNRKDKELEFIISHRFGRINLGFDELFGLDQSNIRFAFEYGLNDNITLGIGRSSYEKTYDSFIKYSLFHQKSGENSFPLAISLFGSVAVKTLKDYPPTDKRSFAESLSYVGQVLIARKINSATQTADNNKRIIHTSSGNGQNSWSFKWTSPSSEQGKITFYGASVSGNGNFNNSGDQVF